MAGCSILSQYHQEITVVYTNRHAKKKSVLKKNKTQNNNQLYKSIFKVYVCIEGVVIIDDSSTFNEQSITLRKKEKRKKCGFVEIKEHNILLIPNRLILYRKPPISKHLHYIKVYAIGSGECIDSGAENHSITEYLFLTFEAQGLMVVTVFLPQSTIHCTQTHLKSCYIPFLPPLYCTKAKQGREATKINCLTWEWPS